MNHQNNAIKTTPVMTSIEMAAFADAILIDAESMTFIEKVEFTDAFLRDDKSILSIRVAAKILNIQESVLRFWMSNNNMIFNNLGGIWEPYATYINRGWLTYKTVEGSTHKSLNITCNGLYAIHNMRSSSEMLNTQQYGAM
ncbi:hypothetical protein CCP4SC76_6240007 [Gammaproteobacteria bacterium]